MHPYTLPEITDSGGGGIGSLRWIGSNREQFVGILRLACADRDCVAPARCGSTPLPVDISRSVPAARPQPDQFDRPRAYYLYRDFQRDRRWRPGDAATARRHPQARSQISRPRDRQLPARPAQAVDVVVVQLRRCRRVLSAASTLHVTRIGYMAASIDSVSDHASAARPSPRWPTDSGRSKGTDAAAAAGTGLRLRASSRPICCCACYTGELLPLS